MKILIVGSGGREHALAWAVRGANRLFIAPGNAGTREYGENVDIKATDTGALVSFSRRENIDLVVVGPEVPLAGGLADALDQGGIACFGPSAAAAEIESSKAFAKAFMQRHNVPTAQWQAFLPDQIEEAMTYARSLGRCVVKASGLAAGKGAIMCEDQVSSDRALHELLAMGLLGDAGREVVVEEWMEGQEASVFALTDGDDYLVLDPAQDHKRAFDNDLGPNTGGMGAYAPAPVMTTDLISEVCCSIIEPTLEGMAYEGRRYTGCLYAGLMITDQGPRVVEFNCRFGDPETQVVLPLMGADPTEVLLRAANGGIGNLRLTKQSLAAACVVLASGGYPDSYNKGYPISGLNAASEISGALVFHAGTKSEDQKIVTAGGRVLGVTAVASSLKDAVSCAYKAADLIQFDGKHMRRDIGHRALGRQ